MSPADAGLFAALVALLLVGIVLGSTVVLTRPRPAREIRVLTNREREDAFRRRFAAHRAACGELAWPFVEVVDQHWRHDVLRALWDSQAVIALRRTYPQPLRQHRWRLYPALAIVARAPKPSGSPTRSSAASARVVAPLTASGSGGAV